MLMVIRTLIPVILLIGFLYNNRAFCNRTHSALSSVVFTNIDDPPDDVHTEYFFGMCATRHRKVLYQRSIPYDMRNGFAAYYEWVDFKQDPSCVYIKATSRYGDIVRYHPSKLTICLCAVIYNYGGVVYEYRYYELYFPTDIAEDVKWHIIFYEPTYYGNEKI